MMGLGNYLPSSRKNESETDLREDDPNRLVSQGRCPGVGLRTYLFSDMDTEFEILTIRTVTKTIL
jgi:hypothetical protein